MTYSETPRLSKSETCHDCDQLIPANLENAHTIGGLSVALEGAHAQVAVELGRDLRCTECTAKFILPTAQRQL